MEQKSFKKRNKAPSPGIGREGPSEGETLSCGWPLRALQSAAISRHELKDQPNLWHQTYNPSKVVTDSPTSLRRTVVHTTFMFLFRASCKLLLDPMQKTKKNTLQGSLKMKASKALVISWQERRAPTFSKRIARLTERIMSCTLHPGHCFSGTDEWGSLSCVLNGSSTSLDLASRRPSWFPAELTPWPQVVRTQTSIETCKQTMPNKDTAHATGRSRHHTLAFCVMFVNPVRLLFFLLLFCCSSTLHYSMVFPGRLYNFLVRNFGIILDPLRFFASFFLYFLYCFTFLLLALVL